ncbi:cytochrome P450 [Apodospora peruviana]|uniref:Cytochrome P450 n=1 Tax=Apodospora peruviana TaxID=516989 RepID=A0AAE0HZK7_9PEZI|nr:cytochrome P450 [Apodospora peruviana]
MAVVATIGLPGSFAGGLPGLHYLAIASLFVLAAGVLVKYFLASRRPPNFPPGPPTIPFIGNITQVPPVKSFLKFKDMKAEYGSIIGLKIGSQNVVVLNSHKHVKALFDQRGSKYSSRPQGYLATQLVCPNEIHILLLPYGAEWRKQRRILQSLLNVKAVDKQLPLQNAESTATMVQLLRDPAGYYDHVRRYTTAVILASVFGQRGARFDAPNVQALYHAQDQFTAILEQGATPPVDAFPFLRYVPEWAAPWKRWARAVRREQKGLYMRLVTETRERLAAGKGGDCYLQVMLRNQEKNEMDDEHLAYLAGNLMEAGSDTTASTLLSFLLAMIKYPEVFKRAQKEVDEVCGPSRSPGPEDITRLPFIKAVMDETLRWRPTASGMIPHMLTEDDTYEGYFLPKGTVFLPNVWAIANDEEEFENPERFMPDRFLDINNSQLDNNETKGGVDGGDYDVDGQRTRFAFGAGRRLCPGHWLAKNSLMLNMAKIAWVFDLSPGPGISGPEDIDDDINTAYHGGFLIAPKKFPITIKPRSERHRAVIENEYEALEPFLQKYE